MATTITVLSQKGGTGKTIVLARTEFTEERDRARDLRMEVAPA